MMRTRGPTVQLWWSKLGREVEAEKNGRVQTRICSGQWVRSNRKWVNQDIGGLKRGWVLLVCEMGW